MKKEKTTQLDYSKYSFRPEEALEVPAGALSEIFKALNKLVETENVGFTLSTDARYEYVHKETSAIAKTNTKKEELDKNYRKVFSMEKTLEAQPTIHVTEVGKQLFSLMRIIDSIRISNLDAGRGTPIEILEQEIMDRQKRVQEAVLKQQQKDANPSVSDDIGLTPKTEASPKVSKAKKAPIKA